MCVQLAQRMNGWFRGEGYDVAGPGRVGCAEVWGGVYTSTRSLEKHRSGNSTLMLTRLH